MTDIIKSYHTELRCSQIGYPRKKLHFTQGELADIRVETDRLIEGLMAEFNATVPYATHFQGDKELNTKYYRRFHIETIKRIRLLRVAESYAISALAKVSPEAAQTWAQYEMEEMLHDTLFEHDLLSIGVTKEEIESTEPYLSTKLLAGYFRYLIEHENPLGVLCYSYLVETVNVKLDPEKINGLKKKMPVSKLKGQISHSHTDTTEDHPSEVWNAITPLLTGKADIALMHHYLIENQKIIVMFFREIFEEIVK
jgi:hypothetical protein